MRRRNLTLLTYLLLSLGAGAAALATPPPVPTLSPSASGSLDGQKKDPRADAEHSLEQLGMLNPLFALCEVPASVSAPYRQLEAMIVKTASTRGVATLKELTGWQKQGEALSRKKWAQAAEQGANPALSCIQARSALEQEAPLIEDTLKRLTGFAATPQ